MQFQAICSKGNRKLTLSLVATNIDEARELLHGQGYSIMEIKESDGSQNKGNNKNFFYFDIRLNNQIKTGKIQSDDVFKSYKKLIDDLGYDVVYIYTNEGMSEEQKKVITAKVRDSYRLYKASVGEDIDNRKIEATQDEQDIQQISPQILREVEHYSLIGDSTIEKIQNLMLKYHATIPEGKKQELEKLEHQLLQNKGSSNLGKIKTVVESALKQIGEIELELVKTGMADEKKKFLEETNSLLKQIGSSDRIETDGKESIDISKTITKFFSGFVNSDVQKKNEKKPVDTNSFIYFKNQRELNLYKESLNKNDIQIIRSILTLNIKNVKKLLLKKKLLLQNIQIIENRVNNKNISYTKIVHGFNYYIDTFLFGISELVTMGIYTLFLYVFLYISLNIGMYFDILLFSFKPKTFLFITIFSLTLFIFLFAFFLLYFSPLFFTKEKINFPKFSLESLSPKKSITLPLLFLYGALYIFLFALFSDNISIVFSIGIYILIGGFLLFFGYMLITEWKNDIFFDVTRIHLIVSYSIIYILLSTSFFTSISIDNKIIELILISLTFSYFFFRFSENETSIFFQSFILLFITSFYIFWMYFTQDTSIGIFISSITLVSLILFEIIPRFSFFSEFIIESKITTLGLVLVSNIGLMSMSFFDYTYFSIIIIALIFLLSVHTRYCNYISFIAGIVSIFFLYGNTFFSLITPASLFSSLLFVFFLPLCIIGSTYFWEENFSYDFSILHYISMGFSSLFSLYLIFFIGWGSALFFLISGIVFFTGVLLLLSYFRFRYN